MPASGGWKRSASSAQSACPRWLRPEEEVLAALPDDDGVTYSRSCSKSPRTRPRVGGGMRGSELRAGAASDTFSQKNQGTTIEQAVDVYEEIAAEAKAAGARCSLTISTAFGCRFRVRFRPSGSSASSNRLPGTTLMKSPLPTPSDAPFPARVSDLFRIGDGGHTRRPLPRAFPQHPEYRPRQLLRRDRGWCPINRCIRGRDWRLSVRPSGDRQCPFRKISSA